MKVVAISALLAAQILQTSPALAAELVGHADTAHSQMGAFAGARLRVDLGGRRDGRTGAGLVLAPVSRNQTSEGRSSLGYGEGIELRVSGQDPASLRLFGHRFRPGGRMEDEDGNRLGVSTLGVAAIAAGVIVVGAVVLALAVRSDDD